jgi:hypothetical protein
LGADFETLDRRSERRQVRMAIILLTESEGGKLESEAYACDLSQHGLRAQTSMSLMPGQLIEVVPSQAAPYAISGRVVWVGSPASEQAGEIGLEFLTPLPSTV